MAYQGPEFNPDGSINQQRWYNPNASADENQNAFFQNQAQMQQAAGSGNPDDLVKAYQATLTPAQLAVQAQGNAAKAQETNAYQIARDASLGMMNPGSVGANGVDYGKAQADPSAALNSFLSSGYTGQQALADGWATGVGTPGWQSTPQSQHLNPNGGNVAAMNPQDPNWGRQATTGQIYGAPQAQMRPGQSTGGPGMFGNSGGGQGIYGQLGQQLQSRAAPRSPYGSFGGGAPQAGNPYAALISSGQQGGGQSQAPQAARPQQPASGGYGGIYGQLQSQLAQRGGR